MIPGVAASGTGTAQTGLREQAGVRTAKSGGGGSRTALGRPATGGESPVGEAAPAVGGIQSTTGHVKPCGKERGPPRKAKYYLVTDRAEYCEGKVKRTPGGE